MEQKKKIAFVANSGFNLYNFRFSLMKKFKEDGYTIIGICPEDAYCELLMKEGFEIIFLHNLQRKGSNPISDYKLYRELYSIYKAHNIDVVLQYTIKPNIYGTLAAKKLAIRIICNITGLGYTFINKGLVSAISKVLYKLSFRKADHVVFQNIQDARLFIEKKYVDAGKTSICNGSGIDVNKYTPIPKIQDDKVHFLFVGRLLKDKGIMELIEAIDNIKRTYPQAIFSIAGDIDKDNPASLSQAEFENHILQNPNIKYLGYIHDTREVIKDADCVVLPSYREGMPRVILEAFAMAKPCIVSDAPGCKEVIENTGAGFMVKTKSSESLIEAIEKFILMPASDKEKMGKNARKAAEIKYADEIIYRLYKLLV